eukprot:TRINITY_DN6213_c0_g1_i1.p1 TRINITY_DN6213_c0_g1~~TRINITY_DN6213_c0_g1_i1.p1  ORF type:complete len:192 (-),score=23.28 TRINITY_DN6213_c0_g1_i1:102-677(-)
MPKGVMVRWNNEKGFGFIKPDDGSPDVFCHRKAFVANDDVFDGDAVKFKIEFDDRRGKDRAYDVEIVSGSRRSRSHSRGGGRSRSRSRSPIRKAHVETRPGDWNCPKCNFLVFASKDECFKCGYRKGDVGSGRDSRGRGGGRDRDDRGRDDRRGGMHDRSASRGGGGGGRHDHSYSRGGGGDRRRGRSYSR